MPDERGHREETRLPVWRPGGRAAARHSAASLAKKARGAGSAPEEAVTTKRTRRGWTCEREVRSRLLRPRCAAASGWAGRADTSV